MSLTIIIIQFLLGYIYSWYSEWAIHKYILHRLGRNKKSWWSFHWHDHHKECRKNNNYDKMYNLWFWKHPARFREVLGLFLLALIHLPFTWLAPVFYGVVLAQIILYYFTHKYIHLNVEWGKTYRPWHYEHHMGSNQEKNFGVVDCVFDYILKTREKFHETSISSKER